MAEETCCDPDVIADYNPKLDRARSRGKKATMFDWTNRRNPLLEQIKDTEDLQKTFRKYPLIPFAGTTEESGHSLLRFLMSMANLSTTHGACIVSQRKFAFGGKLGITKNADPVFDFEEEEISEELKKSFAKFVRGIKVNTSDMKRFAETLFTSYKITGNGYFTMTQSETLGVKSVSFSFHSPDTCLYVDTKPTANKLIAISNSFELSYLDKHPPTIVPLYPNFVERPTGERVTIFHVKDGTEWYGRPDSLPSFEYWYREFQDVNYLQQECDNGFTGKVLIEIEDADDEVDGVDEDGNLLNVVEQFEQSFTNKGENPLSIMFMTRPSGAQPAYVKEFSPNTNEKFFDISSNISERKILISHSWSARLLGESKAAGLSTNLFTDELESKLPLLEGYQTLIENELNVAIQIAAAFLGETEFETMGVKFRTPFNVISAATRDERAGKDMNADSSTIEEERNE